MKLIKKKKRNKSKEKNSNWEKDKKNMVEIKEVMIKEIFKEVVEMCKVRRIISKLWIMWKKVRMKILKKLWN
jgi:hypothetical protein